MIALVLFAVTSYAVALPHGGYSGVGIYGPSYTAPIVPVAPTNYVHQPKGVLSHTVTNVHSQSGAIKQQTAVEKDALGGHTIRHTAQASNVDPHTGQTDVKHDQHEFHINPYIGQAAVHTNNAEGSLNPTLGHAAFSQKTHNAKIAPGHASVADVADTADVSPHSSAASRDVNAARTDVLHEGVAKNAHASHKSYVNAAGVGGQSQAYETNRRSFDGHGYGNLHYDTQAAKQAVDVHGRASANEAGYQLDQAYDARVNLGASNELEYSRHAAHDNYGNYGAVTQTRQASQGGHLIPVAEEVVVGQSPVIVQEAPVVYSKSAAYSKSPVVYSEPAPVVYSEHSPIAYKEHSPVAYKKYSPIAYKQQTSVVYNEPTTVYKQYPTVYKHPVVYKRQPVAYGAHAYGPETYPQDGYYHEGY